MSRTHPNRKKVHYFVHTHFPIFILHYTCYLELRINFYSQNLSSESKIDLGTLAPLVKTYPHAKYGAIWIKFIFILFLHDIYKLFFGLEINFYSQNLNSESKIDLGTLAPLVKTYPNAKYGAIWIKFIFILVLHDIYKLFFGLEINFYSQNLSSESKIDLGTLAPLVKTYPHAKYGAIWIKFIF
jgi:hypothetical protein